MSGSLVRRRPSTATPLSIGEPRRSRERGLRRRADADDDRIGLEAPPDRDARRPSAAQSPHADAGHEDLDALAAVALRDEGGDPAASRAADARRGLDHGDLAAAHARAGGELQPDEAAADDRDARAGTETFAQGERVFEGAQLSAVLGAGSVQRRGRAPVASTSCRSSAPRPSASAQFLRAPGRSRRRDARDVSTPSSLEAARVGDSGGAGGSRTTIAAFDSGGRS